MNLGKYLAEILLEQDKKVIALFPGAFKPPHKGHFKVVEQLLDKADQVVILISPASRDGISPEESVAVWELYKTKLDGDVELKIAEESPVKEVYSVVKNNMSDDFILAFGKEESSRFGNSVKYPNAKIFDAGTYEGLSATLLRSALKSDNTEEIAKYLPDGISVDEFLQAIGKPHEEKNNEEVPPPPAANGFPPFPGEVTPPEQPLKESPPIDFEQDDYQDYTLQNRHKIEKAARAFNLPISDMEYAFNAGREVVLSDEMWSNLQNSKSYKMKSLDEAIQHALKLGIEPKPYIEAIKKGDELPLPLVLCYAPNKYYLVGGEIILSLYKALGSIPTVLQGTLNLKVKNGEYNHQLNENKQSPEQIKTIKTFLTFTAKELGLKKIPSGLTLSHDNSKAKGDHTFGYFNPETDKIWLYVGNRNMADILRTLGHELVHLKQNEEGRIKADSGETGSDIENEANAKAGVLLRNFGKQHSEIYEGLKK